MEKALKQSQKAYIAEVRRAKRLSLNLNKAIIGGDAEKIRRWQKLGLPFYKVPFTDWLASQKEN